MRKIDGKIHHIVAKRSPSNFGLTETALNNARQRRPTTKHNLKAEMQETNEIQDMMAAAIQYLPPENAAIHHENGHWRLRDDAALHFEVADDALLIVLSMPETHLDVRQLEQLLILCGRHWPLAICASLSEDETRALIFARLDMDGIGIDNLSAALSVLLHARGRWLRAGGAR